jgi:hypothetical protein
VLTVLAGFVVWLIWAVGWKWLVVRGAREGIWHGLKVAWRRRRYRRERDRAHREQP